MQAKLVRACKHALLLGSVCLVSLVFTIIQQNAQGQANDVPIKEVRPALKPGSSNNLAVGKTAGKEVKKDVPSKVDLDLKNKPKPSNTYVGESSNPSVTPGLYHVRGFSNDIYLFSVILGNSSSEKPYDSIVIQGLENSKYMNTSFSCCVKYKSGNLTMRTVTRKTRWTSYPNGRMAARQYVCPRKLSGKKNDLPVAVTLSGLTKQTKCHQHYGWYIKPHIAKAHTQEIAVCTKLVYSDLDPNDLLAWFETHRRLGVDKFVAYTYNLNPRAAKVIQYYVNTGIVEQHPFSLPKIDQGNQSVVYGYKKYEARNIEQTLMYDCFERLKGYKYLVVLDIDEYLVPKSVKRLPALFDKLWKTKPSAAGFSFLTHLHITSWPVSNKLAKFTAGRYTKRTVAMDNQMKHVVKPDRLAVGGLSTLSFTPGKSYKGFRAAENEATIHHFRACEKSTDWQKEMDKNCPSLKQFKDTSVADKLASLEKDVLKLNFEILKNG